MLQIFLSLSICTATSRNHQMTTKDDEYSFPPPVHGMNVVCVRAYPDPWSPLFFRITKGKKCDGSFSSRNGPLRVKIVAEKVKTSSVVGLRLASGRTRSGTADVQCNRCLPCRELWGLRSSVLIVRLGGSSRVLGRCLQPSCRGVSRSGPMDITQV